MALVDGDELAAADLAEPRIDRAAAVGEEHRELSIRRDRRVELFALEVRQTFDRGAGQRILPEVILLPQAPEATRREEDNDRCNASELCPLLLSASRRGSV